MNNSENKSRERIEKDSCLHSCSAYFTTAMVCQVRRADVIQYSPGLIAPSLHAAVEGLPLVARPSKGGLTLALVQVSVTVFNLTLGGGSVTHCWRVAHCSGLLGLQRSASCQKQRRND